MVKKYTDAFLLAELRRFYEENGKVPTQREICTKNGYVDSRIYYAYFGTWNNALSLAELNCNKIARYDKKFLISELHRFVEENNRVPYASDMRYYNGYPSRNVYINTFGSWNSALEIAKLKVNVISGYTKEFLISELHRFVDESNRVPFSHDMYSSNGYPSLSTFINIFGSWNKALKDAELQVNIHHDKDPEFLINELYRYIDEFGRIPYRSDMIISNGYPSGGLYESVFGSWNNALKEANLNLNRCRSYTEQFLINELQEFAIKNGRSPCAKDMNVDDKYHNSRLYSRIFGSWNNALKAANLNLNYYTYNYSNLFCSVCGTKINSNAYRNNNKIICSICKTNIWRKNNYEQYKQQIKDHRGFGFVSINSKFNDSDGHHLHLENRTDFVIFIPKFIHKLYYHNSNKPETMDSINAVALDWFLNESLYNELYLTGEIT